jgi:hypothetical protein
MLKSSLVTISEASFRFCLCVVGRNEFEPAAEFIKQKFLDRINNKKKPIYPFITCATNTENFKNIFASVKDIVVGKQMQQIGI